MRRLLVLALPLFALSTHAQEKWVESSVTLSLTLSETGVQQLKPNGSNKTTRTVPLQKSSVGNRQILEALKAEGLIPEIKDWSLVAIWANWPDEDPVSGNTYRFYARKGSGKNRQTVAVPSSILNIAPLVVEVGVKHVIANADETILPGSSESYKVYSELRLQLGELEAVPTGVHAGSGDYKKMSGEQAGRYVPKASKAVLSGVFSRDGETADGVIEGSISFGAGAFVNSYDYVAPGGTTSGSVSVSIGIIDIGFVGGIGVAPNSIDHATASGGTLVLSNPNTPTGNGTTIGAGATLNLGSTATLAGASGVIASGGTLVLSGANIHAGAITVNEGTTLNLGPAATLAGGTLTFSLESAGDLIAANGGAFQFFDGSTLTLAPGATFDLSTLSSQQLGTNFTFTFNPSDGTLTSTLAPDAGQPATPAP